MSHYDIFIRDKNFKRIGQLTNHSQMTFVPRFNAVGFWGTIIPTNSNDAALLTLGGGVVIQRDDNVVFAGPARAFERIWDADNDNLVIGGPCDNIFLTNRRAVPDPTGFDFTAYSHDERTGVASTIMIAYVDYNIGPNANAARKITGLTLAADPAVGESITGKARFHDLTKFLASLALEGGGLGFKLVDNVFTAFMPEDKTAEVIFSKELRNLTSFNYKIETPKGNFIWGGAGGDGTDRTFRIAQNSASIIEHGRIEDFYDYRSAGTDTIELTSKMNARLDSFAASKALSLVAVDLEGMEYGEHYNVGTKVTVKTETETIEDIVREVTITLEEEAGEVVIPVIGTPESRAKQLDSDVAKKVRDLKLKQDNLERI